MVKVMYFPGHIGVVIWLLIVACDWEPSSELNDDVKTEVVELNCEITATVNITEMMGVKSAELIPLQLHPDGLLSGYVPERIVYHDPWFIILERINEPILIFNQDGEFNASYGIQGKGPDEVLSLNDFALPIEKNELYMLDYMGSKVLKYSIQTNSHPISSIGLTAGKISEYSFGKGDLAVSKGHVLILGKKRTPGAASEVLVLDSTGMLDKIITFSGQNGEQDKPGQGGEFFQSGNEVIYLSNHSDTVWRWSDQTFEPIYALPIYSSLKSKDQKEGLSFKYTSYLESDRFLYVSFFVDDEKYIYIYSKMIGQGKLINTSTDGMRRNAIIPMSDYFHIDDSVLYGYVTHTEVLSRFETNSNLIRGNIDVKIPDAIVDKLLQEMAILENAVRFGNGMIVKYAIESDDAN